MVKFIIISLVAWQCASAIAYAQSVSVSSGQATQTGSCALCFAPDTLLRASAFNYRRGGHKQYNPHEHGESEQCYTEQSTRAGDTVISQLMAAQTSSGQPLAASSFSMQARLVLPIDSAPPSVPVLRVLFSGSSHPGILLDSFSITTSDLRDAQVVGGTFITIEREFTRALPGEIIVHIIWTGTQRAAIRSFALRDALAALQFGSTREAQSFRKSHAKGTEEIGERP